MELRRLELEMIREMKKPNEDMCLTDHKVMELGIRPNKEKFCIAST